MIIGVKSLKEYENKEIALIDFILEIDSADNLLDFGYDENEGIAVIETVQTDRKNTVIVIRFKQINLEKIRITRVVETMRK